MSELTYHGKTEIFRCILWHVDQTPLCSSDQDEAVHSWKEGLVWHRAVWSHSSWESWGREEWVQPRIHSMHLCRLSQIIFEMVPAALQTFTLTATQAECRLRGLKTYKNDWSVKTHPGGEQTSGCRHRWRPWSVSRRDAPGPLEWWAAERACSWSHDWFGPVGLWTLLWWICEGPWFTEVRGVNRNWGKLKLRSQSLFYCHTCIS